MLRTLPIFLILLFPAAASAAPADIDRGYGTNGHTVLDSGGSDWVTAMTLQPDGKAVVVASTPIKDDGVVMRFTADGAPDPAFGGGDGIAILESAASEEANAVAVQPDGKIVVGGRTSAGLNGIVRRLNADGSPDRAFGDDGAAPLDSAGYEVVYGVAVQRDGKIVAVGETSVGDDLAAYRLTAQGKPDTTFDEDGARGIDAGGQDAGYAVALQPDGKIVVAGRTSKNGEHPLIARFDTAGKPDESFGPGGWRAAIADRGAFYSVAVRRDGTIFGAGTIWDGAESDAAVYRLESVGDAMFAARGRTVLDLGGDEEAFSIAVQRDDKLVVGGMTSVGEEPVVWRLDRDGNADRGFGTGGAAILPGLGLEWVDGVGVQADGRIVVASERRTTNTDVLVTRLFGDYQPPAQPQPGGQPPAAAVRCAGLKATIVGTAKRDVIRGTRRSDVIAALGGNDVVRGLGADDVICGGGGNDRIAGGAGRDRLLGGGGRDRLLGGAGRDRLVGGPGRDRVRQ